VIAALAINVIIAALKFGVAAWTGSTAMLAEAFHSLADTVNQIFLLLGIRLANRPSDEEHPFGFGSERYFWAFMAALGIFAVGGGLSIYEGVEKILEGDTHGMTNLRWALAVLGGSILLESASLRVALGELREMQGSRGLRATLREARDPTVFTVLFEDVAALVGLVLAFLGVLLSSTRGTPLWDGLASVLIGLVLVAVAVRLGGDAKALLIGRSVPERERRRIEEIARAARGVIGVVHIRTVHLGPNEVMCGLKLAFEPTLDVRTLETLINELEASLRAELPHLRRIYVEPGFDERKPRQGSA
jgi:cation diffusion facilitator family transporter